MCTDAIVDKSVGAMSGVVADTFVDGYILVVTVVTIAFVSAAETAHGFEVSACSLTGVVFGGVPRVAVEGDEHGLVAVMTALEFTLPAPLEDSSISC